MAHVSSKLSAEASLRAALEELRRAPDVRHGEVHFFEEKSERLQVRDGRPEVVATSESAGASVRVLGARTWGFACTADLTEAGLVRAAREALAVARASSRVARKAVVFPERPGAVGTYETKVDEDPFTVPIAVKLAALDAPVRELLAFGKPVQSAEASMEWTRIQKRMLSTEGGDTTQSFTYGSCGMQVTVVDDEGHTQCRSYPVWVGGNGFQGGYERITALDLMAHTKRIAEEARDLLVAPPCPAGVTDVILESSQVALQIHESCGHPAELDRAMGSEISLAGGSFLQPGHLDTFQYGSSIVDIVADSTTATGLGTFGWDDEGTPAGKHPLVREGVFVDYLSGRETAAALGRASTGTMRAEGYNRAPLIRMVNVSLEPGAGTLDDLIADTKDGVYFECDRSWSIDDLRLNFQFTCELAWEIKNGTKTRLLRDSLYTGVTPAFWRGCDAITGAAEWKLWGVDTCGKGDPMQMMHVGHGASPARFRGVTVGAISMTSRGDQLLALARESLAAAGEAEVEIVMRSTRRGFARFAIGELGQHMALEEPQVLVRVAGGKGRTQVASTSTNRLEKQAIVLAIHDAARAAERVPETEGFAGFAEASEPIGVTPARFSPATAALDAEGRADRVAKALDAIAKAGLVGAGALETRVASLAVATTRGRAVSHDGTTAQFKVWALETPGAGGAAGYGGAMHRDVDALDLEAETREAIRICLLGKNATSLDAGAYDVVMEPPAVGELVEWLSSIAFSAAAVEQGTSALRGRLGERITGESITMTESPLDNGPFGVAAPFDREGIWRQTVPLIERGIAKGVLYDRASAVRAKAKSTGSALLPDGVTDAGIGASAIYMEGGSAGSTEELIAGVTRGLYVCRLHYVNGLLDPRRAVMTGLTRDGCFLIEHGKLTRPVGNLRFTDSFLEGLARADGMTRARRAVPTGWSDAGAHVVPAIRLRGFRWNGRSQEGRV